MSFKTEIEWRFDMENAPLGRPLLVCTDDVPDRAQTSVRLITHWTYVKRTPFAWADFPENVLKVMQ